MCGIFNPLHPPLGRRNENQVGWPLEPLQLNKSIVSDPFRCEARDNVIDKSFNRSTIARRFLPEDFYKDPNLKDDIYREMLVNSALDRANNSSDFCPDISVHNSLTKPTYSVNDLRDKLILRHCARIVKTSLNKEIKPRNKIISEIRGYLGEGSAYRVYKLDIKSFFESCNSDVVLNYLCDYDLTTQLKNLITSFVKHFNNTHQAGLPRGVEISPILAELVLDKFDLAISSLNEVFYYSRFVDDIFMITSSYEDKKKLLKKVREELPDGLQLNYNKTQIIDLSKRTNGDQPHPNPIRAEIEYLGYKITVIDNDLSNIHRKNRCTAYRTVKVDLSNSKVDKIVLRISKSFHAFYIDSDFQLLKDRITFLTTNRDLVNKRSKRKIPTGIYYSYSQVDLPSEAMKRVDNVLKVIVLHHKGRLGGLLNGKLSADQKGALLKLSFSKGHYQRIFKRFSPNRLRKIAEVWS